MDAATIAAVASSAVTALVPFLTKGGEKLAEKAAEEGFDKRAKIWNAVKGLFIEDELLITNFSANPEDAKAQGKLEGKLEERLKSNSKVADELSELLKQLNAVSNKTSHNYQQGRENYNIQNSDNAKINRR